jgi:hypothetical protein
VTEKVLYSDFHNATELGFIEVLESDDDRTVAEITERMCPNLDPDDADNALGSGNGSPRLSSETGDCNRNVSDESSLSISAESKKFSDQSLVIEKLFESYLDKIEVYLDFQFVAGMII